MNRLLAIACLTALSLMRAPARCDAERVLIVDQSFNAAAIAPERARLQRQLRTAMEAFDAELANRSSAARAEWHAYLKWNSWAEPLLKADAWDADAMKRVSWRLYTAEQGFENPLVVDFRTALTNYLTFDAAVREANGDLEGEFRRRAERLRRAIEAESLDFTELEAAAWWLAATRQAPAALAQVRARYDQPAIVVSVHRELVEAKLDQFQGASREQRPTRHRIQGTTVVGTASVTTHTTAELLDLPAEARLRVESTGSVQSPHNMANSGRVRVASSSNSRFSVSAEVYFDGEHFAATAPQATADVRSTIKRIDAPLLIRRAAARRVQGSRTAGESEGESLIEREAAAAMSMKLAAAVEKLNRKSQGFLNFVTRTGNKPARWSTQVNETSVQIGYLPATPGGVGALPHEMPPMVGEETLGLSFHDAGLESIFRALLAGKRWTDVNFATLQRELTGANSEELMIGLSPGRWNAQWSWRHPVRIHFTSEKATVRYRFSRVEIDGSAYDAPFEVRAEMQVSAPPLGFEMRLLAPATIESLDPEQPLPPHFQAFLERKFRGLFGERFHLDGLQFPAGGALDAMSAFRVASARLEPNWVHLRYTNRKPQATLVSRDREEQAR